MRFMKFLMFASVTARALLGVCVLSSSGSLMATTLQLSSVAARSSDQGTQVSGGRRGTKLGRAVNTCSQRSPQAMNRQGELVPAVHLTPFVRSCTVSAMRPSDSEHGLEAALEVVLQDLKGAEQDMARASFRVHHAREAATGLQALVGPKRAAEIADRVGIGLPVRRVQTGGNLQTSAARRVLERRQAEAAAAEAASSRALREAMREVNRAEQQQSPGTPVRREATDSAEAYAAAEVTQIADGVFQMDDYVSSTDRVVQLLKEHEGTAIPRAMILDQFDKRGWIQPSWSHPGPAIRMAIRRAVEKGAAKAVDKDRYMYSDPGLLGDLPSGGEA